MYNFSAEYKANIFIEIYNTKSDSYKIESNNFINLE